MFGHYHVPRNCKLSSISSKNCCIKIWVIVDKTYFGVFAAATTDFFLYLRGQVPVFDYKFDARFESVYAKIQFEQTCVKEVQRSP